MLLDRNYYKRLDRNYYKRLDRNYYKTTRILTSIH